MGIREWIMRQIMKAPWLDDEKREAQRARLAVMQEELDRAFETTQERRARESAENKRNIAALEEKLSRPLEKRP